MQERSTSLQLLTVHSRLKEVTDSGIEIPSFSTNVAGGCAANADAAADDSRCWWTCSGCVRDTDIEDCPEQKSWCMTFDDGPSEPTPNLLQYLGEEELKATFFVVGSRVVSTPELLRAQYMAGHQIASQYVTIFIAPLIVKLILFQS